MHWEYSGHTLQIDVLSTYIHKQYSIYPFLIGTFSTYTEGIFSASAVTFVPSAHAFRGSTQYIHPMLIPPAYTETVLSISTLHWYLKHMPTEMVINTSIPVLIFLVHANKVSIHPLLIPSAFTYRESTWYIHSIIDALSPCIQGQSSAPHTTSIPSAHAYRRSAHAYSHQKSHLHIHTISASI